MENHFVRKYKKEYDTTEELVDSAINMCMIPKEERLETISYLKEVFSDGNFYNPTHLVFDDEVRVPRSLKGLKGILKQREMEQAGLK